MTNFESFKNTIADSILNYLPSELKDAEIHIEPVNKLNNQILTGLRIMNPARNFAPVIYLDSYFEKYERGDMSLNAILDDIAKTYQESTLEMAFSIEEFSDFELVKSRVVPRLIDGFNNDELLVDKPHKMLNGLAVMYVVELNRADVGRSDYASISISNQILQEWKITEEQLHDAAMKNLESRTADLMTMTDVLLSLIMDDPVEKLRLQGKSTEEIEEIFSEQLPPQRDLMYVLTNESRHFGASVILNSKVMDDITERIGEFYILPSSLHEVILVPREKTIFDHIMLEEIVRDINATQLDIEEKLSDLVFLYDSQTKELYRADQEAEHLAQVEAAKESETIMQDVFARKRGR